MTEDSSEAEEMRELWLGFDCVAEVTEQCPADTICSLI